MRIGHVIYLSSSGCALWSWHGTEFVRSAVQVGVGVDPRPVVDELATLAAGPIAVLVDMVDEEHIRDTVPRLGRADQRVVVGRKLARAFARTSYRTAILQGRNAANADEDHVLLCALTRPEPLRQLMARLVEAKLPVATVVSPALLVDRLLDAEARAAPAALMVLRRGNGRVQHSFFRAGRLTGSRRLRAAALEAGQSADLFHRQLEESLRYFDATFTPGASEPLQLLLPASEYAMVGDGGGLAEGWQPRPLDLPALRRRLRLPPGATLECSERLFIELLRRHAGDAGYAAPEEQRYFHLARLRTLARAACVALAAGGMAGALYNGLLIADARQRMVAYEQTAGGLESLLPVASDTIPQASDPLWMQQVVLAHEALAARAVDPREVLTLVAAALAARPLIRLESLRWTSAPLPLVNRAGDEPDEVLADDTATVEGDGEPVPVSAPRIAITVRGRIQPFAGDYPQAFAELEALMAALRAVDGVEKVTAIEQPLDVDPASTLSGELAPGRSAHEAGFALEVIVRQNHESV